MNILDAATPAGRELASILEGQARRAETLKDQACRGALRLPSMSGVRRGMARQSRLDDLRAVFLEGVAATR